MITEDNIPHYKFYTNHYCCDNNSLFSNDGDANCIVIATKSGQEAFINEVDRLSKSYGKQAVQDFIDGDKEEAECNMIDDDSGWDDYDSSQKKHKLNAFKQDMKQFCSRYKIVGMNELAKRHFQQYLTKWAKREAKKGN